MQKKLFYYLMSTFFLCTFIFLTGCDLFTPGGGEGVPHVPAKIEIISPQNGTIFPFGTDVVTIHGRIIPGSHAVVSLKQIKNSFNWFSVDFNPETYEFTTEFELDPSKHYSTCALEVSDSALVANMERVSYIVGEAAPHGDIAASNNALSISMTENLVNGIITIIEETIRNTLPETIASLMPIHYDMGRFGLIDMGEIVIDPNKSENRGVVIMEGVDVDYVDCMPGDQIKFGFALDLYHVEGYHDSPYFGHVPFVVNTDKAGIHGIVVGLSIDEDDNIVADVDLTKINVVLENTFLQYGWLSVPSWLTGIAAEIAQDIIKMIPPMHIPIMHTQDFVIELGNLNFAIWSMDPAHVFTTTEDAMTFDLGISATIDDFYNNALYPDADEFLVTENGPMPDAQASEAGDDLVVVVSDELINQGAFAIVQSGLLKDIDLSAAAAGGADQTVEVSPLKINASAIGSLIPEDNAGISLKVSIETPPICDFSGAGDTIPSTESFGTYVLPNLIIELGNIRLVPGGKAMTIKLAIDVTADLGMNIEGDILRGSLAIDMTEFNVEVLYFSEPLGTDLMNTLIDIGLGLATIITGDMIEGVIEIELPENDYFTMPNLSFSGNKFVNDYLVIGLTAEF